MAPNIDKEAEHIKKKARKELLELLEGVSATDAWGLGFRDKQLTLGVGAGEEELGDWQGLDWLAESLYPISHVERIWRRQGFRARKWKHRLIPEEYCVPCAWGEGELGAGCSR